MPVAPTNVNYESIPSKWFDVKSDFGAMGDGITDDSAAFNNAISALVNDFGGGKLLIPAGTYLIGTTIKLPSQVHLVGAGIEATVLKLKSGTNADLLQGAMAGYGGGVICNAGAANASGSTGGIYNWSLQDLTLDGNKAGQSSGTSYCCRVYGYGYILENIRMRNGYSGGLLSDWNGGSGSPGQDNMEAQFVNVKIHDCNGIGLQIGGPHDSQFVNFHSFNNGSHCIHIAPNATALQFTNCHAYLIPAGVNACGWLIEAGYCMFYNCESEGTDGMSVALLASECLWFGHIFGNPGNTQGMQLGQTAGNTPYPGMVQQSAGVTTAVQCGGCVINGIFDLCALSHGAIWFANDTGNNIHAQAFQTSGNAWTGTPSVQSQFWLAVKGLTADGTFGKSGAVQIANSDTVGFVILDASGNQFFQASPGSSKFLLGNGAANNGQFGGFSDAFFGTQVWKLDTNHGNIWTVGWIASGPSASSPDPGANGTVNTTNVGMARVTPASNRAGCILQAGTQAGQEVWVVNESTSKTISWATQATSNISGEAGGTFVLAANGAQKYVWDSSVSLWFKAA
jgi:hypothetical protein